jgi:hypothetical protein
MDLEVRETGNGGDIYKKAKDLSVIDGWQNMPYLAMFGGNVKASTANKRLANEQAFDYWGNSLIFSNDPGQQFNSLTERTLNTTSLTSEGRLIIQSAVEKDMAFMKAFADVAVDVIIPATDKVEIKISIKQPDNLAEKEFIYIWDASKREIQ